MGILGQSVNVAASLAFAELFKEKKISEQKKMETRPKLREDRTRAIIGKLQCDAVIEREMKFESEVTENPVEDGFNVADHVSRKPLTLQMTVMFTPTPVTWYDENEDYHNRLNEVVNALQDIYKKGEPVTVITVDAIYKNMLMLSAPLPRKVSDGYCYSCQINFVQVRRVKAKTESLPNSTAKDKNGATETDAGQTSTEDIGTGVTTIDNIATTQINTTLISKEQSGDILTGNEQKTKAVTDALLRSLRRTMISYAVNKIAGKSYNKASGFGKMSKAGGFL